MRIAYVAEWDSGSESGVLKKIVEQVTVWTRLGHEVRLFLLSPTPRLWRGLSRSDVQVFAARNPLGRTVGFARLTSAVRAWQPDGVYLRFYTYRPTIESILQRYPTVAELNTDDVSEYRLYLDYWRYRYHLGTRARVLSRVRGVVAVTNELAQRVSEEFHIAALTVANGIPLNEISPAPVSGETGLRFAFIGAPHSRWHGMDKILELSERRPDWEFDLIGPGAEVGKRPNVRTHGLLTRPEYARILAKAHVAIGTLGLHRKQMWEASPLKVREYLAFGLPVVIGYRDSDFPNGAPFLLEIPNTETNLVDAADDIATFADSWRDRRVPREAVAQLDVATKEQTRLDFIESVVRGG